jgi:hypothetical protein
MNKFIAAIERIPTLFKRRKPAKLERSAEEDKRVGRVHRLILQLIDAAPTADDKQAIENWKNTCIRTLRECLAESQAAAWLKVHAALHNSPRKKDVDTVVIQLQSLHAILNHEMIRTEIQI